MATIETIPDEVLEYILTKVSPYTDLKSAALVNKRWQQCVHNVKWQRQRDFQRAVQDMGLIWSSQVAEPAEPADTGITKRYSHSACYHDPTSSMFVFGGCAYTSTTFNDLWQLDLTTRQWSRPLSMGTYPSPKACASMVIHENSLYLFGGWTHPSLYPLHQSPWRLFNELHVYDIIENRWTNVLPGSSMKPPLMAGHSATIHNRRMIVFGGLQKQRSIGQFSSSNDIWCFNIDTNCWYQEPVPEPAPTPRYGQSQLYLDESHILILGGCGGPNNIFNDVWLLIMKEPQWRWVQCEVKNQEQGAVHMWCHQACKDGDFAVVLGKNRSTPAKSKDDSLYKSASVKVIPHLRRGINRGYGAIRRPNVYRPDPSPSSPSSSDSDMDVGRPEASGRPEISVEPVDQPSTSNQVFRSSVTLNINPEATGAIPKNRSAFAVPEVPGIKMAAFASPDPSPRTKQIETRQKQLETLRKMEEKLKRLSDAAPSAAAKTADAPAKAKPCVCNRLTPHVLDIRQAVSDHVVTWIPVRSNVSVEAPEETILYSLVRGRSELIMFGGIQKDVTSLSRAQPQSNETVSNSLFFLNPPAYVV